MKKNLILFFLFFFIISLSFAQSNFLLWKISGNGLKQDSYLFGTIHMLCPDDFEIKQKILTALAASQKVIFEVDLSKAENMSIIQKYTSPDPDFIKAYSKEEIRKMDSVLTAEQFSIKILDYVSPITAVSLFSMKSFNCPDPRQLKSFEAELLALAHTQGKTVGELETPEFQFSMLKDLITPKLFMESVFQLDKYPDLTAKMVNAYKNENLAELTKLIQDPTWMSKEQKEKLLNDRNKNWVNLIPALIKEESCFLAVGAGHLLGEQGLIPLLQSKGYTVTAVN